LFLDGVKAALTADAAFAAGWYRAPPIKGLQAFSRVYAGWAFSQDFFREQEYRKIGLASVEDVEKFLEGYFRQNDANDLLAMLWTWQHAEISANSQFRGDFVGALHAIRAKAIAMPCASVSPRCRVSGGREIDVDFPEINRYFRGSPWELSPPERHGGRNGQPTDCRRQAY